MLFDTKVAYEFVQAESKKIKELGTDTPPPEELEGYYVVKASLRDVKNVRSVIHRE